MSLGLCFPSWWHDLFSWCSASMNCALDHATCMCAMVSFNWYINLDCITNFCSIVLKYVLPKSCWKTDILGCCLAKWLQQCLRAKSECHNVNRSGFDWLVYTNGRFTHFEWTIFCWCGRTRKGVQKGNQKKARTGEGRQSAFTRSASFLWPDNGTQFESFFLFTNAITEQSLLSNMWMYIIVEMLIMIVHNALCQKLSSNFMLYAGHNLIVIIMSHNMNCFKNIKPWSFKKISTMLTKKNAHNRMWSHSTNTYMQLSLLETWWICWQVECACILPWHTCIQLQIPGCIASTNYLSAP